MVVGVKVEVGVEVGVNLAPTRTQPLVSSGARSIDNHIYKQIDKITANWLSPNTLASQPHVHFFECFCGAIFGPRISEVATHLGILSSTHTHI